MLYAFSDSRFWTIVYRDFSYGFTKITTFVFGLLSCFVHYILEM
jgi:hypothetical protein